MRNFSNFGVPRHLFARLAALAFAAGCSSGGAPCDGQQGDAQRLCQATGTPWILHVEASSNAVRFAFPETPVALAGSGGGAVLSFLAQNKVVFGMSDPVNEWSQSRSETDERGFTHFRWAQVNRGVAVVGGTWLADVDASGRLSFLSGNYLAGLAAVNLTATQTPKQAAALALAAVTARAPKAAAGNTLTSVLPAPVIYSGDGYTGDGGGTAALAFEVETYYADTASLDRSISFVDAHSGALLFQGSALGTATAQGQGAPNYSPYKDPGAAVRFPVSLSPDASAYLMEAPSDVAKVPVETSQYTPNPSNSVAGPYPGPVAGGPLSSWQDSSSTSTWSTFLFGNSETPGSAVSAQSTLAQVADGYYQVFNRNSFDGQGSPIQVQVDAPNLPGLSYQAAWAGLAFDGTSFAGPTGEILVSPGTSTLWPLDASLDCMAHEFGHGVSQTIWNANYTAITGALNEAMSDILAMFVSYSVQGGSYPTQVCTHISDAAATQKFRNLAWPHDPAQTIGGPICDSIGDINGTLPPVAGSSTPPPACQFEIHHLAGVIDYTWYLMTFGGTHESTQQTVPCGIGWPMSQKLWWLIETAGVTSKSSFADVADRSMALAAELGLDLNPVGCAWVATQVYSAADAAEWHLNCLPANSQASSAPVGTTPLNSGACNPVAALSGLRWELPCSSSSGGCPTSTTPIVKTATLAGLPGAQYQVTLQFRGVVEQRTYTGTNPGGAQSASGGPPGDGGSGVDGGTDGEPSFFVQEADGGDLPSNGDPYNIYSLQVSDVDGGTAATYFLNSGQSYISEVWPINYQATIPIRGGATVTLTANAVDGLEIPNPGAPNESAVVVPGVPPAPAPYNGQFVQVDAISVVGPNVPAHRIAPR